MDNRLTLHQGGPDASTPEGIPERTAEVTHTCRACKGTGRDPTSETLDWLTGISRPAPCSSCRGTGTGRTAMVLAGADVVVHGVDIDAVLNRDLGASLQEAWRELDRLRLELATARKVNAVLLEEANEQSRALEVLQPRLVELADAAAHLLVVSRLVTPLSGPVPSAMTRLKQAVTAARGS